MKNDGPGLIEFRGIACLSGFLFCNKLIYHELELLKRSDAFGVFTSETPKKISETVRLARLSSVGIAFILCSFIGYGIGYYIDKWVDTKPVFTIIFVIFGIGAGFLNVYRAVTKDTD